MAFIAASSLISVWCVTNLKEHRILNDVQKNSRVSAKYLWNMLASLLMWLWLDLTRADYTRHTKKNAELKQLCTEKWYRIPFDHCAGLIRNYKKPSVEVITAKGGSTGY